MKVCVVGCGGATVSGEADCSGHQRKRTVGTVNRRERAHRGTGQERGTAAWKRYQTGESHSIFIVYK